MISRRSLLAVSGAGIALTAGGITWARRQPSAFSDWMQRHASPLPIPRLMDFVKSTPDEIYLKLAASTHDFGTGTQSETYGINADYLGPVLRVKSGQILRLSIENGLSDPVALHWHGLHIPGKVDGGPHQEILPGSTWAPAVPITQRASMNWFHSHTHGLTAQQVYRGMAGILLVEDEESLAADLPQTYGVDDFSIVLQDKMFDTSGRLTYELTADVFEDGFEADTLVLNGVIAPVYQNVPKGLVRLRILNACNARFLELSLSNDAPLAVIASDGGFLSSAVETQRLRLSSGERYEILLDMSNQETLSLNVSFVQGQADALEAAGRFISGYPPTTIALTLRADPELPTMTASMPDQLANLPPARAEGNERIREFNLDMATTEELTKLAIQWGNFCGSSTTAMGINGQPMSMDRIDEKVGLGETEIWRITADDMRHPFHIHGCSFRILKQKGAEPPRYAQGWKDMVTVEGGASEVLVRFDHAAKAETPYMYHCHILEHEDCGMMGQFTVE